MKNNFLPERIGVCDRIGKNVLIRGVEPLIGDDNHFAYDEIAKASGVDLHQYQLLDVCLIDNVGERWAFAPEMKAFGVDPDVEYPTTYWPPYLQAGYNPKKYNGTIITTEGFAAIGSIVWWPIEGLPDGHDPTVYLESPGWNLNGLVGFLMDVMAQDKVQTAIYMHCMVGSDRTGAAHIGYLMKSMGMSLQKAIDAASKITKAPPPRPPDYMNLVQAYAKFLGV